MSLSQALTSTARSMKSRHKTMSHIRKLIIPILGAVGLYLACIKKKNTPYLSGSMMGKRTMKVSYNMLLKATAGFSSENLLGTGSFGGSVFKGILDGTTVAVKVLNLQHRGASKSFIAECNTLRIVRHRNLLGIITVCSSIDFQRNDLRALVYKFMPNRSLDRWLYGAQGNISLAQRLDLATDMAHAISYLHHECETPVVHCNLKPSNILLDNDMVAHVGDSGLARFLTRPRDANKSSTIGIRGTIGYSAPEYGLGSEPSPMGDVYSSGILLLELMTGKSPTDSMFKEGYSLHMHAEAALPDQVIQIVDPALEKDNHAVVADDTRPTRAIQDERQRIAECITLVISIGVSCSNHLPHHQMKITEATRTLHSARNYLLSARKRHYLPARGSFIPDGLRDCSDLQYLYMEGNYFHGNIPSSLVFLINLQEIDFPKTIYLAQFHISSLNFLHYTTLTYLTTILREGFQRIQYLQMQVRSLLLAIKGFVEELNSYNCQVLSVIGSDDGECNHEMSYNMLLKATAGFSVENLLGTGSFGSVFK